MSTHQIPLNLEDEPRWLSHKQKILARLREGPVKTIELLGPEYGIRPAARIKELRSEGFLIETRRVSGGQFEYDLIGEPL